MEVDRTDGLTQALRCVAAMEGQDLRTRTSLWRAALRYRNRDTERAILVSGALGSGHARTLGGGLVNGREG